MKKIPRIYKVLSGCSEGFFSWMTPETKDAFLKKQGLTFMYNESFRRFAVYYNAEQNVIPDNELGKLHGRVFMPATAKEFLIDYYSAYKVIGCAVDESRKDRFRRLLWSVPNAYDGYVDCCLAEFGDDERQIRKLAEYILSKDHENPSDIVQFITDEMFDLEDDC